jgi:hypothetical protein
MKIRPLFILAMVLACSSVAFSFLGRLDSTLSSVSMGVLAVLDFSLILYFSAGQRYAQVKSSSQIVNFLSGVIIIVLFCLVAVFVE